VRIILDAKQLAENPLRIGLSMAVTITVDRDGPAVGEAPRAAPAYVTAVFDEDREKADAEVARIIRGNLAEPLRKPQPASRD